MLPFRHSNYNTKALILRRLNGYSDLHKRHFGKGFNAHYWSLDKCDVLRGAIALFSCNITIEEYETKYRSIVVQAEAKLYLQYHGDVNVIKHSVTG